MNIDNHEGYISSDLEPPPPPFSGRAAVDADNGEKTAVASNLESRLNYLRLGPLSGPR